jgi:restriction system protein
MAIPDFQSLLLPVLNLLADGKPLSVKQVASLIADALKLSTEERALRIPSGYHTVIYNRTAWAITYLRQAKLIASPKRGIVAITDEGKKVVAKHLAEIDMKFLEQYPAYIAFRERKKGVATLTDDTELDTKTTQTPDEAIEDAYRSLRQALADSILDSIMSCKPEFFEKLVVELLVAMGYGGSREDAGKSVGQSGDGGIDGVIKEDRLGLDKIVVQAKRYDENQSVGRPKIQEFIGAMDMAKATKGVFITTSTFSQPAIKSLGDTQKTIVLIDGQTLADYMIDFNIGVASYKTYALKRIDGDYFEMDGETEKGE